MESVEVYRHNHFRALDAIDASIKRLEALNRDEEAKALTACFVMLKKVQNNSFLGKKLLTEDIVELIIDEG